MNIRANEFTAVAARVRTNTPSLTGIETKVAGALTNFSSLNEKMRVRDVADPGGVSDAHVVKVSKTLGSEAFKEIKAALIGYRNGASADLHDEFSPEDDLQVVTSKVFRMSIPALEETRAILDIKALQRTAQILARADTVEIYGIVGSAQIARDISHSGNSEAVIADAERARKKTATVIALSNDTHSPLADIADITLASTALGGPSVGKTQPRGLRS